MAQYLITYDNKPPRNYAALYHLMSSWNAVRLSESVWLANLAGPAGTVRDIVLSKMQRDDLVTVVELKKGSDWAVTQGATATAKAWLSNNVTPSQAAA
ncbi:hypothetical protein [Novosphingobium sp. B 225]|uniref:hypothetical protein n=1 Tax=Novosphingobium sp. B 225 TaxID=1961849 RepID=UPI001124F236|nr:hypothetical protein [Novosphingobium sp. B 225]